MNESADKLPLLNDADTIVFHPTDTGYRFNETTDALEPATYIPVEPETAVFPPHLFQNPIITVAELRQAGYDIEETTYLTLGGGLGSYAWVDVLRICGVPADKIVAIGMNEAPHGRYRDLARQSRIPDHERLRSDSSSTADNIWGWPGYAVREVWQELRRGKIGHSLSLLWRIFSEPALMDVYTPRADNVYASIEREVARIGWQEIWRYGRIKGVRKTDNGRYVVAYMQPDEAGEMVGCFMVADYIHLALGYPGVQFLADLQAYRARSGDIRQVVNAYEDHEHVYEQLARQGGMVLLRGRGIVASRLIQQIYEIRQKRGVDIQLFHLHRSPKTAGKQYLRTRRMVEHHWEFQPYNWPKAAFGGEFRFQLEEADAAERDRLIDAWGGTTTAARPDWRHIVDEGVREGWYKPIFGEAMYVIRAGEQVVTQVQGYESETIAQYKTDFIIDATGLHARIESHPVLNDLLHTYQLRRNPKQRLHVENDFELPDLQNPHFERIGRAYASGAMTFGGPFAAVDSFVGLQFSALRMAESLAAVGAPDVNSLTPVRSIQQWLKWAGGETP